MKPERHQLPWTAREDSFLRCPIPATNLVLGALRGRTVESIRCRRRQLRIFIGTWYLKGNAGRPRYDFTDYPEVDWDAPLKELMAVTGFGINAVCRLRQDYRATVDSAKPSRPGRREYVPADFPGANWKASASAIARDLGVSRPVATRLKIAAGESVKRQLRKR